MADGGAYDGLLVDQRLLIPCPPEHQEDRLRFFCADRTPLGVVRQGARHAVARHLHLSKAAMKRPVILDCSAGEGGILVVLKEMFPKSHRIAVEPRPECEEHLRRHAQEVIIGSFIDHDGKARSDVPQAHIIIGNPPFADGAKNPLWMTFWKACTDRLLPGGFQSMLGLNEIGQRGKRDHMAFMVLPPDEQAHIAGPIKFRGVRRGADLRCYSWWNRRYSGAFSPDPLDVSWRTAHLPWLPKEDREWRTIPGHEP